MLTTGIPLNAGERPRIEGAWRFVNEVDTRADGSVVSAGPAAGYEGLLIYTADGFMSVNVMPKGRRWRIDTAAPADLRETIEAGSADSGRYEVDPRSHTVTHLVAASLDPADEGKRLVRAYSLEGDTLSLSGTWSYHGETLKFTLTWSRVR